MEKNMENGMGAGIEKLGLLVRNLMKLSYRNMGI